MKIRFLIFIQGCLLGIIVCIPVHAAENLLDLSLEDLARLTVSTVSKKTEPVSQAPGIVTVVSRDDIRRFGGRTLADVLMRQPSMLVFGSSFLDNMAVSVRGGKLTHTDNWILLLINGRPIRESHNGGLNSDIYTMFPVEIIERIEIIRGPGSVIYGTNAFTGVVNIITQDTTEQATSVYLTYGSFNTTQATLTTGFSAGELKLNTAVRYLNSDGWEFEATDEVGVHDSKNREPGGVQLVLQGEYKDFTLDSIIGDMEQMTAGLFQWSQASGGAIPPGTIQRRYIDLGYHPVLSDNWDLSVNYTFNGHSMEDVSAKRQSNGSLLETTARYYFSDRMDVLMGAIGEHVRGDLNSQADGGNYDVVRYNAYAQLDYQFTERLDFVLGGQWNKQESLTSNVSPRASVLGRLTDNWGLKVMYGEAYREPFAFQSFFNVPSFKGNPTLKPELIATYDIQLLYDDAHSSASLTYFESRISDSHLRTTVNGVTTMENSAEDIESNGAEMEFKTVLTSWFQMQGSMLYQQNSDANNEDVLFNPNLMAKIGFTITPNNEYRFSVFNSYFSEAGKLENIDSSVSVVNPPASSYHLLTLQIEWNPLSMKNVSFSLYGDNLLGAEVYFPDLNRRAVNTIPQRSGQALYATVEFRL